jgi:hypothetical protein
MPQPDRHRISGRIGYYSKPIAAIGIGRGERQLDSNRRHWTRRLETLERDLATEPDRIQGLYKVQARRIEPVGLVYLWPVSGPMGNRKQGTGDSKPVNAVCLSPVSRFRFPVSHSPRRGAASSAGPQVPSSMRMRRRARG